MDVSDMAGRRVLVTGATGFIGGRLVEVLSLAGQTQIQALIRNPARASRIACFPVELISGDITHPADVKRAAQGCDIIFHCAYDYNAPGQANVKATRNVIEAAAQGVRRVVHVSSIEVYEPVNGTLTEESPYRTGKGIYARSKVAAERLALTEGARLGLEVSVVQPTVVYGPYGSFWTTRLLQEMATGQAVLVDEGVGLCNAVYIDDVIAGLLLAATRPEAVGETFIVSAAKPVTWADFYWAYERMLGRPAVIFVPKERIRDEQLGGRNGRMGTLTYLARVWRDDPNFRKTLRNTSTVHALYGLGHRIITPERWQRIRRQIGVSDVAPPLPRTNGHLSTNPTIHWPNPTMVDLLTRRSRADISKIVRLLGYQPRFTLATGMKLTEEWARWGGLC